MVSIKSQKLFAVHNIMSNIICYLEKYQTIVNSHITNFFVDDLWKKIVSQELAEELLNMDNSMLSNFPCAPHFLKARDMEIVKRILKLESERTSKSNASILENSSPHSEFFLLSCYQHSLSFLAASQDDVGITTCGDETADFNNDQIDLVISVTKLYELLNITKDKDPNRVQITQAMCQKKSYEVDIMADLCSSLAANYDIGRVIDVGTGLGYLGAHLALMHGLQVLGIDSILERTEAAAERTARLQRQWKALLTNAVYGGSSKSRKKKLKKSNKESQSSSELKDDSLTDNASAIFSFSNTASNYKAIAKFISPEVNLQKVFNEEFHIESAGKSCTNGLTETCFESSTEQKTTSNSALLLTGLHTCGDLASTVLEHFVNSSGDIKLLCLVSCCYNLLTDRSYLELQCSQEKSVRPAENNVKSCNEDSKLYQDFSNQENSSDFKPETNNTVISNINDSSAVKTEDKTSNNDIKGGFPLSKFLLERNFKLTRNAKLLSTQCPERFVSESQTVSQSILWRAVLQLILVQHCPTLKSKIFSSTNTPESIQEAENETSEDNFRVGKLTSKCSSFVEYVRKALEKLQLDINISDQEILNFEKRYTSKDLNAEGVLMEKRLTAFHMIRIAIAPCIESLILLDRLAYLLQQDSVDDAFIVQVFDKTKSPRCYALVAVK